jgi:hypothetical protein
VTYLDARALWPAVIRLSTLWSARYAAFGRCLSPLPREWLRFLGGAGSQLMKLARLTAVKAGRWPSPKSADPAGRAAGPGSPSRAGIQEMSQGGDVMQVKYVLTALGARAQLGS